MRDLYTILQKNYNKMKISKNKTNVKLNSKRQGHNKKSLMISDEQFFTGKKDIYEFSDENLEENCNEIDNKDLVVIKPKQNENLAKQIFKLKETASISEKKPEIKRVLSQDLLQQIKDLKQKCNSLIIEKEKQDSLIIKLKKSEQDMLHQLEQHRNYRSIFEKQIKKGFMGLNNESKQLKREIEDEKTNIQAIHKTYQEEHHNLEQELRMAINDNKTVEKEKFEEQTRKILKGNHTETQKLQKMLVAYCDEVNECRSEVNNITRLNDELSTKLSAAEQRYTELKKKYRKNKHIVEQNLKYERKIKEIMANSLSQKMHSESLHDHNVTLQ